MESELQSKLTQQKKEFDRQNEDMILKATSADDQKKEIQRQSVASSSEFEKQKALLD
jgi:hypothetical protein